MSGVLYPQVPLQVLCLGFSPLVLYPQVPLQVLYSVSGVLTSGSVSSGQSAGCVFCVWGSHLWFCILRSLCRFCVLCSGVLTSGSVSSGPSAGSIFCVWGSHLWFCILRSLCRLPTESIILSLAWTLMNCIARESPNTAVLNCKGTKTFVKKLLTNNQGM